MSRIAVAVAFSMALTGAGCCTMRAYTGGKRPKEAVARIKGRIVAVPPFYYKSVSLAAVDGEPLRWCQNKAEVLPGKHTVSVYAGETCGQASSQAVTPAHVTFEAEAGHRYQARAGAKKDSPLSRYRGWGMWAAWIVDRETGATVGGEGP